MNVSIIYWSGTGNTEAMANLIGEGAKEAGAEILVKNTSEASLDDVKNADVVVLGCPSMGDEVLEEYEFEPFVDSALADLKGKKVALFGSYGWGDGRWMREWHEKMQGAGCTMLNEGLIVNGGPAGDTETECKDLGKTIATA